MKLIKTVDAEGTVLCHDITQIIKGVTKDAVFRKGHIVTKEDIPVLLSVGKDQLYVWEKQEGILHENEAAEILCRMCRGDYMSRSEAKEGKIELKAECPGLLKWMRFSCFSVWACFVLSELYMLLILLCKFTGKKRSDISDQCNYAC